MSMIARLPRADQGASPPPGRWASDRGVAENGPVTRRRMQPQFSARRWPSARCAAPPRRRARYPVPPPASVPPPAAPRGPSPRNLQRPHLVRLAPAPMHRITAIRPRRQLRGGFVLALLRCQQRDVVDQEAGLRVLLRQRQRACGRVARARNVAAALLRRTQIEQRGRKQRIVREVVQGHDRTVTVQSAWDTGTVFTVWLPRVPH